MKCRSRSSNLARSSNCTFEQRIAVCAALHHPDREKADHHQLHRLTLTANMDVSVSQLQLPDPLEERDETALASSISSWPKAENETGDEDDDRLSLISSTGLSELSLLPSTDDENEDEGYPSSPRPVSEKGRLRMSVASTRSSGLAASSLRSATDSDSKCSVTLDRSSNASSSSYSIISHWNCPSPSYSITGVLTPSTPARHQPIGAAEHAGSQDRHSSTSLLRSPEAHNDTTSVATKEHYSSQDGHQKDFDLWLKSATPHSQRSIGSDHVSAISSLGSPLAQPFRKPPSTEALGRTSNVVLSVAFHTMKRLADVHFFSYKRSIRLFRFLPIHLYHSPAD